MKNSVEMTPNRDDADVRKSLMEEGLPTWTKNIPKRSLIAPVGPAPEKPTITPFQLLLLAVMVLQNSAVVLLGRYTQTHENSKPYSASNLVVAAEMLKFIGELWSNTRRHMPLPPSAAVSYTVQSTRPSVYGSCRLGCSLRQVSIPWALSQPPSFEHCKDATSGRLRGRSGPGRWLCGFVGALVRWNGTSF